MPARLSTFAQVNPVEPLSLGGYGPSPSRTSSSEYSLTAPGSSRGYTGGPSIPADGGEAGGGARPSAPVIAATMPASTALRMRENIATSSSLVVYELGRSRRWPAVVESRAAVASAPR